VVVVRAGGAIHAFVNRCPHAGHPLDLIPDRFMSADGSALICSSHGALFRPDTGVCTAGPCVGQELRSVPITVADGWVCLTRDFRLDDYDL
jgi:nitrite reductase/ring-hydroxylating ferredoxin subunit